MDDKFWDKSGLSGVLTSMSRVDLENGVAVSFEALCLWDGQYDSDHSIVLTWLTI